jgi:outer membrane immunogenic protein
MIDTSTDLASEDFMWRFARFVLLSTTATTVFSLSAMAADLPNRMEPVAPVAYVPAFSWTGFYLGGELGWMQTNPKYTTGALLLGAPFAVRKSPVTEV